ncbi:hypothetical protein E2C01_045849 [Portunus trituberculatus]|uniref:Uncharacterized protein n=1 Tax=Portunus trituberculatus TaxID=210409 RepID=A0A5B7FWV9_PORTR|nr:hypothetical protein [Portunus trituberculatus]
MRNTTSPHAALTRAFNEPTSRGPTALMGRPGHVCCEAGPNVVTPWRRDLGAAGWGSGTLGQPVTRCQLPWRTKQHIVMRCVMNT